MFKERAFRSDGGEGDPKKVRSHFLETKEMKYTYIQKNNFPVENICNILNISKSGYYDWLKREDSKIQSKVRRKNSQSILGT
ncbi:hypothetical protein [Leptospira santarosai]|uniref:hypothetical protein n=1 Tax=Leptospira santarosai TaxID=28183 RepID=UPI00155AF225|nr:hypothetical protein [Leptospira santarosai]